MANEKDMTEEKKPEGFDKLMEFLDAETYQEKMELLDKMQLDVTDFMIDTMAVSLDVTIPDGDISDRYRQLKSCLAAKQRYEVSSFR